VSFYFPTPRLIIRPWLDADRPALQQMVGDAEMMRHIGDGSLWSEARIDDFLARQQQHLKRHGVCFGAVALAESDRVIGLAGMQMLDTGDFELGWWIWKDYRGQGLAVEAVLPFIRHARDVMELERLVAVIDPPNSASIRVAEKLGMAFERRMSAAETLASREDRAIALYALNRL
jgi:ribosomal-protein-alanine N-acetyltransferase